LAKAGYRDIAISYFNDYKYWYHPMAREMIEKDLDIKNAEI